MDSIDSSLRKLLIPIQEKPVLLSHPFFQYFLKRYGFILVEVIEPMPGKEPAPRAIQKIIETVQKKNIPAIFTLPQLSQRPSRIVAEATGIKVFTLDRDFPALSIELVMTGLRQRWPGHIKASDYQQALIALKRVDADHLARRTLACLSGGESQRVYLARSLVRNPRLVMLAEPASGIDAVGEADLYRLLESYQLETRATIMMITHDWHVARHHASHVLVLHRRKIGFGPPELALSEKCLRRAFGHIGHTQNMQFLKSDA